MANAQYDWLSTPAAGDAGWTPVTGPDRYRDIQQLANRGQVVVAVFKSPNPHTPGHATLILPEETSPEKLADSGPAIIMAGTHNHNMITLRAGFRSHVPQWPEDAILFYVNSRKPF